MYGCEKEKHRFALELDIAEAVQVAFSGLVMAEEVENTKMKDACDLRYGVSWCWSVV